MGAAKGIGDLLLHQVDRRRDDVARRLVAQLDDVFAEIGFDRGDAVRFEMLVEGDLLGDHRFALGDDLGIRGAADIEDRGARLLGIARPMHMAARGGDVSLVKLEVEIEICQHMVLDRAALFAQFLEFRQARDRLQPALRKPGTGKAERLLQDWVGETRPRICRKAVAGRLHVPIAPERRSGERRLSCRRALRRHGEPRHCCRGATISRRY